MGLRTAIAMVVTQVRAITPTTDTGEGFTPHDDATGMDVPLERIEAPPRDRLYDVVITSLPVDDGAAAVTNLRLRCSFAVRVLYARAEVALALLERKIAEDVAAIVRRMMNPNNWSASANLIDTIDRAGAPTSQTLGAGGATLVSIPFSLVFYES